MTEVEAPIGIFDSGVGGLTVLRQLRVVLPNERLIYLGDTARVPYGTKSERTVQRYAASCAGVLLQHKIKALVVACNTATAFALPSLQSKLSIPTLGVVEPGARAAVTATQNGKIGVVATAGTIRSGAYQNAVHNFSPEAEVYTQAAPLLVALAEEGWVQGGVPEQVVSHYLSPLLDAGVDTLILGCTHYPLLKDVIQAVCGESVKLIDSAESCAVETQQLLVKHNLLLQNARKQDDLFLVSDAPERFTEVGKHFLGETPGHVEWVDF